MWLCARSCYGPPSILLSPLASEGATALAVKQISTSLFEDECPTCTLLCTLKSTRIKHKHTPDILLNLNTMLISPMLVILALLFTLVQADPPKPPNLCFYKQRGESGCDTSQPYFCCEGLERGRCCRGPPQGFCGCMDASPLSREGPVTHDSVIFYQTSNGKNPIDDRTYAARINNDKKTSPIPQSPLNECSIRAVVGSNDKEIPFPREGPLRNVIQRKRAAPKTPPANDCWWPDVVYYKPPGSGQKSSKVPPEMMNEVAGMLDRQEWDAMEQFRATHETLQWRVDDARHSSDDDDATTLVGSGSDGDRSIGSGSNR
ncbi:hypothetical protein M409DRAFT_49029 [Zasmidium cellare ATCC 36951]|uniref:Uncharacterized protein n=1 Tax=Zasmidium cellare ATCC 36951 TaxID=1080233 RepID=A0A6A6D4V7_ZASCE|nr:uncharacterized protein M409DRAFT_49029 [Zasmidium cellare ATCC 36951]KAF2174163.1 hypothetical protein M409DRAFT_49029 [Zasmidium cellare ATCC 36951]